MDLRLGLLFLFLCCFTAIKCWVELDIAGNDMSNPNPQFIQPEEDCDEPPTPPPSGDCEGGVGGGGGGRGGRGGRGRNGGPNKKRRRKRRKNKGGPGQGGPGGRNGPGRNGPGGDGGPESSGPSGDGNPDGGDGGDGGKPSMKLINSKKEPGKEDVQEQPMPTSMGTEFIDMEPKTSVKIETYTVPYTVNEVKYKTVTRKVTYIQRRRKIKRTINKPVLVIKRKVVKEKQTFERVVPKVIETREIINKPQVDYKVIEGPMEEVGGPKPPEDEDADCDPEAPVGGGGGGMDYGGGGFGAGGYVGGGAYGGGGAGMDVGAGSDGIGVGFDFGAALNAGIGAAFGAGRQPQGRSGSFATTPCPPGMVDNGLGMPGDGRSMGAGAPGQGGSSLYASNSVNAYGQPVLSFQQRR